MEERRREQLNEMRIYFVFFHFHNFINKYFTNKCEKYRIGGERATDRNTYFLRVFTGRLGATPKGP